MAQSHSDYILIDESKSKVGEFSEMPLQDFRCEISAAHVRCYFKLPSLCGLS